MIPGNVYNAWVQTGNAQVLVSWNLVPGATSYSIQRSLDGVTFTTIASPVVASYLDTAVTVGIQYYYQVAAVNADGTGPYTSPQGVVPVVAGKTSLGSIRLAIQQRSDLVNSNQITLPEWNSYINLAAQELYDLLTTVYQDQYVAQPAYFTTTTSQSYPLPDGITAFTDMNGNAYVAPPLYKLLGVDLGLNNTNQNSFVTVKKFNFIDRNAFIFPNTASTIYGVFNLQYRMLGDNLELIPSPQNSQPMRLWYIPRMPALLQDTDILDGINGWYQYVIVRTAKYAYDKQEWDSSTLDQEILFLKQRIEESAINRDAGQNDTISDVRNRTGFGNFNGGGGPNGFGGYGW